MSIFKVFAEAPSWQGGVVFQAGRGALESVALGNIGLSIQDPNASWARQVQTSKDMLAFSLGMMGARAGLGKAKSVLPKLGLRDEAKVRESADDGFAETSSEQVTPFNPPPGTMMVDLTIGLARSIHIMTLGARDFASWSGRMTKRFGTSVQPHLQGLWEAAQRGAPAVVNYIQDKVPEKERQDLESTKNASNTTRTGITRKNRTDWKATRDLWDQLGYVRC